MKKILTIILILAFLMSGCYSEKEKQEKLLLDEMTVAIENVLSLMAENQTESALMICNNISSDFGKNKCYIVYIEIMEGAGKQINRSVCDSLNENAEIPSKNTLEKLGEEKLDYEKFKEEQIEYVLTSKEKCYSLSEQ